MLHLTVHRKQYQVIKTKTKAKIQAGLCIHRHRFSHLFTEEYSIRNSASRLNMCSPFLSLFLFPKHWGVPTAHIAFTSH